MIKMILAIGHINYDKLLNNMLEMAKQHPEQIFFFLTSRQIGIKYR